MDEQQLKEMMASIESNWQKQSDDLMSTYMEQYKELTRKAAEDMKTMIANAQSQLKGENKPEPVHMRWMQIEDQNVLLLSEKAGKDILSVIDAVGKLLPMLKKLAKAK